MPKLSLLIFSINESKEVISLAKEMRGIVDQIVVIDSSDKKNFQKLLFAKKQSSLDKMEIFHAPALGYAEPFRSYGISKCKGDWIVLLDTDERLSPKLTENLRKIIENADFDVLKIKRYENVHQGKRDNGYYTWQVRLFRKDAVEFFGLTHETPIMKGSVKKLRVNSEYLNHLEELRHQRFYNKMDLFSVYDPLILMLRDFVIGMMNKEMSLDYLRYTYKTHTDFKKQRSQEKKTSEIAKIIHAKGLIKYLGLDKEATIQKLDKKYSGKKQGIDLLVKLLKDRYNNKYP